MTDEIKDDAQKLEAEAKLSLGWIERNQFWLSPVGAFLLGAILGHLA